MVVNFAGFKDMVNAVHGVTVCVPTAVNDDIGHIHLPAGTYKVNGNQALDYVRVRHDLGAPNGDIGRMKRQQAFISAMIAKVYSAGTLTNPVRLFNFLNAATSSLTTDTAFANLKELASLGRSLKDIGLDKIKFITVPNQPWSQDPNRLVFAAGAAEPLAQGPLRPPARQAGGGRGVPGQPAARNHRRVAEPQPVRLADGDPHPERAGTGGRPQGGGSRSGAVRLTTGLALSDTAANGGCPDPRRAAGWPL